MPSTAEIGAAPGPDGNAPIADVKFEPFVVIFQQVNLELNFLWKEVKGSTTLKIFKTDDDLEYITLDARQCEIDKSGVTVNNQNVKVQYRDPYDLLDTPKGYQWGARQHHLRAERMKPLQPLQPLQRAELPMIDRETKGCQPALGSLRIWLKEPPEKSEKDQKTDNRPSIKVVKNSGGPSNTYEITVPFRITHVRDGLNFVGADLDDDRFPHAYTRHSIEPGYASCLFPCVDDRTRVDMWRISLKFPRTVHHTYFPPASSSDDFVKEADKRLGGEGQWYNYAERKYLMAVEDRSREMTAVCSGNLVGEHDEEPAHHGKAKRVMTFEAKHCGAQHIGFAVGPFENVDLFTSFRTEEDEQKLAGNAVRVHGYCLPGRENEVCNTCQPLSSAVDFFTFTFSKYPFDGSYKICFVDDTVEDTVPLRGFSLISSRLLYPDKVIDTEIEVTRKLVHTVASQYFGIFINPNELTDTWIVVGLAYYMTDLYMRKLAGNNYYRYHMKVLAENLTQVDHGRPCLHDLGRNLGLGDFEMDFMALKAPLVIFILDRRLLKSSNSSGVTRVISQRLRDAMQAGDTFAANFVVSSEQFRRNCEKKGRLRLEDFWDQWVHGSGCPRFHVTQRFNKKRLEVEVTVIQNQVKWAQEPHVLEKNDFWRDVVEERHNVEASEVPLTFTGPMTFRVHEADGTPYEHCLEIKLDAAATKGSRLSMPYNTKYKRIKRTRRNQRAKEQARNLNRDSDRMDEDGNYDDDKGHTLNTFGDVLVDEDDMNTWKLVDWDNEMQTQMDQESYEWIRVDCDFEWIYSLETNFKVYMTVAQLQQDRDVAGQVESMLTLARNQPSNIQTTMLLRTLYDNRYFYGIRTMAANALTRHAERANNYRGMHHLMRVFKKFFCYPDTTTPRPNDFSNKKEYYIQLAIPMALAKIRGGQSCCPEEARHLILDQLVYNNNDDNPYADHFYVAQLLEALATSLIRVETNSGPRPSPTQEEREFLDKALEQIDRYEKMDSWMLTYKNIWVVTSLHCKMKLMKNSVIDIDMAAFLKYAMPQNHEAIQIKAFEALIELGCLLKPTVLRLLLTEISTHRSPYVRHQLFKFLTRGLAAIAFGEVDINTQRDSSPGVIKNADPDGDLNMDDDDDGGLIVEQSDEVIKRRQDRLARQRDITVALKALKETFQNDTAFQEHLWKAIESPFIGVSEKRNLLELCGALFPTDDEMMVTMEYPTRWKVTRLAPEHPRAKVSSTPLGSGSAAANMLQSCVLHFKTHFIDKPDKKKMTHDEVLPAAEPAQAPVAAPMVPLVAEKKPEKPKPKIKISRPGHGQSFSMKAAESSPAPSTAPAPRQPSVAIASSVSASSLALASQSVRLKEEKQREVYEKRQELLTREPQRQPSVAAASPASAPRQPSIAVSTPRTAEHERGDSISVQNKPKPVVALASAAPSVAGSPTPEPVRAGGNAKSAKLSKKRKLAETESPAGQSRPRTKIVRMSYSRAKLNDGQKKLLASILSSSSVATPADSIVASARTVISAPSPRPRDSPSGNATTNGDVPTASSTSNLSAGSSSQPLASQQKTPLPNGKPRKPLPSGSSPARGPPPTPRSLSHTQSNQTLSGSVSPLASRSSVEPGSQQKLRKLVKLRLPSQKLRDAAAGKRSGLGSTPSTSSQAAPGGPQEA